MKASDIQIGDWLRLRYTCRDTGREVIKDFRVAQIRCCGNDGPLYVWSEKGNMGGVEELESIPITGEILEKNFQEFLPGINLMYQLKGPYCAMNEDGQWVFGLVKVDGDNSARYPLVKISFVHELQNALRLCGIKKEIEL